MYPISVLVLSCLRCTIRHVGVKKCFIGDSCQSNVVCIEIVLFLLVFVCVEQISANPLPAFDNLGKCFAGP